MVVIYKWAKLAEVFSLGRPFRPSLIFKARQCLQGWQGLPGENTLAYLKITAVKGLIKTGPKGQTGPYLYFVGIKANSIN
jgi:hypothetical protein